MNARVICVLICFGVFNTVVAQSIYNSTSIFIPGSTTIYASDVNNDGYILNNGTIETTGNWNNGNVYQGLGTVSLTGTNQLINNSGQSIHQLLISGGGIKTLDSDLVIDGSIEFASGIINIDDRGDLLITDDANIEGGSASSFVDGPLSIQGTGLKFFPIGRGTSYYPVTLTNIQGVKPTTQLAAYANLPDVTTTENVDIDQRVYWKLKTIDGSYSGSPISAPVNIDVDEANRIVFVTADKFDHEFEVIETDNLTTSEGIKFATSKDPVTKSIFAIGSLPDKPVKPGYLSTTLSPNAANPDNRLVKMFGDDIQPDNFHFTVVNRWGNVVFASTSLNNMATHGWDGKTSGQILPAGAYPYHLSYVDRKGKESSTRGFIIIIH